MKTQFSTEAAIESLVNAHCGEDASARERHVYREALRGLVRLAVSEQILEMKMDINKAAGALQMRQAMPFGTNIVRLPVA